MNNTQLSILVGSFIVVFVSSLVGFMFEPHLHAALTYALQLP